MQRLRYLSAPVAWLMLAVFVLGGGLFTTHSHDGLIRGEISSIALSDSHDLPGTTEHVEASTDLDGELCPACAAGRRQGTLDASQPTSRSPQTVTWALRETGDLVVSAFDALLPAPRGPPTV